MHAGWLYVMSLPSLGSHSVVPHQPHCICIHWKALKMQQSFCYDVVSVNYEFITYREKLLLNRCVVFWFDMSLCVGKAHGIGCFAYFSVWIMNLASKFQWIEDELQLVSDVVWNFLSRRTGYTVRWMWNCNSLSPELAAKILCSSLTPPVGLGRRIRK